MKIDKREMNLIQDVLHKAGVLELPKPMTKATMLWIDAIAKIRLQDNSISYGIVKRNIDLSERILYINGSQRAIAKIEEYYPVHVVAKEFIHTFRDDNDRDGRIKYLINLRLPYQIDFANATINDLNKEVVKAAMYQQIKQMENNKNGR